MRLKFREVRRLDPYVDAKPNQTIHHHDRSPGVHLSDIIYDMGIKAGLMKDFGGLSASYLAIGLAWEDWYGVRVECGGEPIDYHFGEVIKDEIAGSPDGKSKGGRLGLGILHEIKTTKMSSKRKFEDDWYWGTQIKSYAHMLGVRECYHHTLYLNGNYGSNRAAKLVVRGFTFTSGELKRNWEQVLKHRDLMGGRK